MKFIIKQDSTIEGDLSGLPITTYCEKEAAKLLEAHGGHGTDSTLFSCEVVDTISENVIGLATIFHGDRKLHKNTASTLIDQLKIHNHKWHEVWFQMEANKWN